MTFKKVLIPVDFSSDSYFAIRCLSKMPGVGELVLLHVIYNPRLIKETKNIHPDVDYARLRLEELKRTIEIPRLKITIIIEESSGGDISEIINKIAENEDVSLIMMGRRGKGIIETLLIGSNASDILRYGKTDLLLIHPTEGEQKQLTSNNDAYPDLFSHLMICTDFSTPEIENLSDNELLQVKKVTIFHSITSGETPENIASSKQEAKEKMQKISAIFTEKNIPVLCKIYVGDAAQEILAYSEQTDVSLIVLKSGGKTGILTSILGSTTNAVARSSKKPVLIFKRRNK